jgi:signal transduction histidine kinase
MRSLFARILLWFLVTTVLAVGGMLVITALRLSDQPSRQRPYSRLVPFLLNEARHAYETGGRDRLAAFLERLEFSFQAEGILTDAKGRDLLTGEDRTDLIRAAPQRRSLPFFRRRRAVIGRMSDDGRYGFFFLIPRGRVPLWVLLPQHLWVLGALILLSYALARHLTNPLRRIEKAVERFGQGDFSARTGSMRKDELGRLARTFDQMAERIQTLLSAERRLLMDISHELRSPLARLGVAVELARTGENREAALDRVQKEADRLNEMVGELLQVTRAETDPSALRFEPLRLDELLRRVASDAEIEARAGGSSIKLSAEPGITTQGDPELLRRALDNIVRNAIGFSPQGHPVEIGLERQNGGAFIHVRDYGPGVPEDVLPRIFDAFYRVETDRNRSTGGVGLGLAIARRAIHLHRGKLNARNAHPGLRVEVELPLD